MLIESFHQTFLRYVPLLKCQIFTHTAKNVRVDSELKPINCTSVTSESTDTVFSSCIPNLYQSVLSSSGDDIVIRSVHGHTENIGAMMFELFTERNEVFFAGFSVPSYNGPVFTAREYRCWGGFNRCNCL